MRSLTCVGRGLNGVTVGVYASLYAIDATCDSRGVGQDIHASSYAIDASMA